MAAGVTLGDAELCADRFGTGPAPNYWHEARAAFWLKLPGMLAAPTLLVKWACVHSGEGEVLFHSVDGPVVAVHCRRGPTEEQRACSEERGGAAAAAAAAAAAGEQKTSGGGGAATDGTDGNDDTAFFTLGLSRRDRPGLGIHPNGTPV